ncbi:hypothetical protein X975_25003, partial [Stegodyphus mimosarum]
MIKKQLRRVLGKASLKYEETYTVLCDMETVINCQTLNLLIQSCTRFNAINTFQLLQDNKTVRVPDLDNLDSINLTKRYWYQQKLWQELKRRFREEYLGLLIQQNFNKNNR